MGRLGFVVAGLVLCMANAAYGQLILKTNLLHPAFVGGASVAAELKTGKGSSTSLYLSGGSKNNFLDIYNTYKFYNITLEERFYLSKRKTELNGFYLAPYFKFMHRNYFRKGVDGGFLFTRPDLYLNGSSFGAGLAAGWQFAMFRNWELDLFGGLGTSLYITKQMNEDNGSPGYIDMRTGLSIGYKTGIRKPAR